jgi:hypothetical protein
MAKRLSIVLNAMGQESGLLDFISATAKNAPERESALVLSAAGQVFKPRHNQTDPLPWIKPILRTNTSPRSGISAAGES